LEISLISLKIHHKTTYRFNKPVALGPHRLMLRPRENRDLRLISSHVTITPESVLTWAHDVFGNAVTTATFQTMADNLVIDSVIKIEIAERLADDERLPMLLDHPRWREAARGGMEQ
jgi:hypothetical protein